MTYLVSVLVATLLFFGFLLLTLYEGRRGVRFFAGARYKLDMKITRTAFLIEHIDWGAFSAHVTRTSLNTIAHDIAHGTLILVRATERFLTRAVRALRTRRDLQTLPGESATSVVANRVVRSFRKPREVRPMNDIVRKEAGE
jgi:hypothetical protein